VKHAFRIFLLLIGIGAGLIILAHVFSFFMGVGAGFKEGYYGTDTATALPSVISASIWINLGSWLVAGTLLLIGLFILGAAAFAEMGEDREAS